MSDEEKSIIHKLIYRGKIYANEIKDRKIFDYLMDVSKKVEWFEWDKENNGFFRIWKKRVSFSPYLDFNKISTKYDRGNKVKYWYEVEASRDFSIDCLTVFNTTDSTVIAKLVLEKYSKDFIYFLVEDFDPWEKGGWNDKMNYFKKVKSKEEEEEIIELLKSTYSKMLQIKSMEYKGINIISFPKRADTRDIEDDYFAYHIEFIGKDFVERTDTFSQRNKNEWFL